MQAKSAARDDRDLYHGFDPSLFTDIEKAISYEDDIVFEQGIPRQEFDVNYEGKSLSRLQKPHELYDGKKIHHTTLCPSSKDMKEMETNTLFGANFVRIIATLNKNISSQHNSELKAYSASYKLVDAIIDMMRKDGVDVPNDLSSASKDILVKYYNADESILMQCKLSKFLTSQFMKRGYMLDSNLMHEITNYAIEKKFDEICQTTKIDRVIIQEILDDAYPYLENMQIENGQKFVRYKTKRVHFAVASIYAAARNCMPLLSKEHLIKIVNNAYFETNHVMHLRDLGIHTKGTNKIIIEESYVDIAQNIAKEFPNPKDFERELMRQKIPFSRLKHIMDKRDLHGCMRKMNEYSAIPKLDADKIINSILAQSALDYKAIQDIYSASKIILNAYRANTIKKISVIDISAIVFISSRLLLGNGRVKHWDASGFSPVVNKISEFLGISTNTRNKSLDQEQYNRVIFESDERNPVIDTIINQLCLPQEGRLILDGNINSIIEFFIRSSDGVTRIYDCRWQKKRRTYDLHTVTVEDLIQFLDLVQGKEFDFVNIYANKMGLSYGKGRVIRNLLINLDVVKNVQGNTYRIKYDKEKIFRIMRQKFVEIPFASSISKLIQYGLHTTNDALVIHSTEIPWFKIKFLLRQISSFSEFTESDLIQGGFFDRSFIKSFIEILMLLKIIKKNGAKYTSVSSNSEIMQKILTINANICSQLN